MHTLHLDFHKTKPAARAGYGLAIVGGLAVVLALGAQSIVRAEIERYRDALDAGREREVPALPRGVTSERDAMEGARAIVGRLAGPWEILFQELEQISEPNVALLALTPDVQKRQIRIYAEGRSFAAMLSYYRALEQSSNLRGVVLLEHEIQNSDPQRPVRFTMTAAWGEAR